MPHIHEKIDYTADVFIVHKKKVLLRMHDKHKIWLAVGGHIELNEDPTQAAVREAKEEVGLDVTLIGAVKSFTNDGKELLVPRFVNRHSISSTHEHVTFYYFGVSESDDVRPSGNDISNEWRWFSQEELEKNVYGINERICFYALAALEAVGV